MLGMFRFLKNALVVVLAFVGVKMLVSSLVELPSWVSLVVVFAMIGLGILASILIPEKRKA